MTGLRHSLVLHTLLHYKDPNIYIGHSSRSWASSLRCACLFCEVEPTLWAPKLSSIRTSFAQYVLLICIFLGRLVASRQSLFFQWAIFERFERVDWGPFVIFHHCSSFPLLWLISLSMWILWTSLLSDFIWDSFVGWACPRMWIFWGVASTTTWASGIYFVDVRIVTGSPRWWCSPGLPVRDIGLSTLYESKILAVYPCIEYWSYGGVRWAIIDEWFDCDVVHYNCFMIELIVACQVAERVRAVASRTRWLRSRPRFPSWARWRDDERAGVPYGHILSIESVSLPLAPCVGE